MKLGDLELSFGDPARPKSIYAPISSDALRPATEIAENQKQVAKKSLLKDEIALKEDELALMVIEDPLKAEQLIIAGELMEEANDGARQEDSYE